MENIGIYVHIPFCRKKCKYCDFVSFDDCDNDIKKRYVSALVHEVRNNKIRRKVDTIYLGGGTPSILLPAEIGEILHEIYNQFEIAENVEVTLEINPGTVDFEKLRKYKEIGINRLSIGLQSTHDRLLKILGRIHCYQDFLDVYEMAQKLNFNNINVDLMLGLPTQTMDELVRSLSDIVKLHPNHISIYSLILEEGTELERLISANKLEMISEDLEREMYWKTKEILENSGYIHYEISNFAKSGFASKHNLSCWNQGEYIGFGLSAHSYVNETRFSNIDDLKNYICNNENNELEKNKIIHEKQNKKDQMKEYMMLGFRKIKGISILQFKQKFGINPLFYFKNQIEKLVKTELVEVDLDKIRLTKKGLDFANIVFEEFV